MPLSNVYLLIHLIYSQKNIVASLVPDAGLIFWGMDDNDNNGVRINANSGGGGGQIHPPSSCRRARRRARRAADLLARDASYGDLRTPLHKAVAGSQFLAAQLLVRASRRRGVLREVMRARDASGRTPLESARAYASIPPDEAETEGAWVRRWDVAAGGVGADWATCLRLLEHATATAAADVARDGAASTGSSSTRVGGGVSLRSGRRTERYEKNQKTTSLPYIAADW
jgi:hypothetical protein